MSTPVLRVADEYVARAYVKGARHTAYALLPMLAWAVVDWVLNGDAVRRA